MPENMDDLQMTGSTNSGAEFGSTSADRSVSLQKNDCDAGSLNASQYKDGDPTRRENLEKEKAGNNLLQTEAGSKFVGIKKKLLKPKPGSSPARQKAMLILIPVLSVVFFVVGVLPALRSVAAEEKEPEPIIERSEATLETKIDWELPEPYPAGLRDPMEFEKEVAQVTATGKPVATGILYSIDDKAVLVDGQILRIGDKVSGYTVANIESDMVQFEKDGQTLTQKLKQ